MYCKLFASLYQGTLRGRAHEILVFTNLLAHADQAGMVDKHFKAIAEEIGITIEEVKTAILALEAPDTESRSQEAQGARITRLEEHRNWGWKVVNYGKYRAIRNEEDRREQNRLAQLKWRENRKHDNKQRKQNKPRSAQAEAEAEAEERKKKETPPPPFVKPTTEELKTYGNEIGLPSYEQVKFALYWEDKDWKRDGKSMKDWKSSLKTWKANWEGYQAERPTKPPVNTSWEGHGIGECL